MPVKVTIFSVRKEVSDTESTEASSTGSWDKQALGVDQADAIPGIRLNSRIASPVSGVFVSTKKDDVKFPLESGSATRSRREADPASTARMATSAIAAS